MMAMMESEGGGRVGRAWSSAGSEQGLTFDWNTMCRRQRMSQCVRVGITRGLAVAGVSQQGE